MPDQKQNPNARQALLEDMFDPETVEAMKSEAEGREFQRVDDDLETHYRCPACSFEWSGNPKPPLGVEVSEDGDGEA